MLRNQVITEWNVLKEIIRKDNHNETQFQWGRLLKELRITSFAPNLDLEEVIREIKNQWVNKREADAEMQKKVYSEKREMLKSIESLRNEANKRIIIKVTSDARGNNITKDLTPYENAFNSLKTSINFIYSSLSDEDGPTIEEVD